LVTHLFPVAAGSEPISEAFIVKAAPPELKVSKYKVVCACDAIDIQSTASPSKMDNFFLMKMKLIY
jgi:hypothetical protein